MARDRLGGKRTLKVDGFLEEFEKEEVKRGVDIVSLFESFGVSLSRKGKGHAGICPWHDDHEPSLSVDQEKGLYHCFGCGESGDVVDLVEKMKGLGFREALEYLKSHAAYPQVRKTEMKPSERGEESTKEEALPAKEQHPEFTLTTISDYYHKRFYESKEAQAYLAKRGIGNAELYSRYKIGFADGSLLSILSDDQKEHLKELGIIRDKGREHFYHCITIPIIDERGQSVGLYGRNIDDKVKIKHLYLRGKHRGIFNRKASRIFDEIIVTESIIDALSLIELGLNNVQALYGLNGFTEEHLLTLKNDRVKTVVLALDNDEAGHTAAERLKRKLILEGFEVKAIFPPSGKDWNDYLLEAPDSKTLKSIIEQAELFKPDTHEKEYELSKDGPVHHFRIEPLSYRIQGVREIFLSNLRVNIKAEYQGESFYDNLDLYSARSRSAYSVSLSRLFNLEPRRIEKDLILILECIEEERDSRLAGGLEQEPQMSEEEKKLGMEFLRSPDMFRQIIQDMEGLGYVGEDLNKQFTYIAASSRKLDDPISILLLSQSAAGKSMLVDTVKRLMPEEDVVSVTSLSDQALNYLPPGGLLHKFLILGEAVHNELVEHQIREMLSGHELSRMVTLKDEKTGKMTSRYINTKVIVAAMLSSTNYRINPENATRYFLINADESQEQTKRIHQAQREKYSLKKYYQDKHQIPRIIKKHVAAQRLLRNILIVNPFAQHLDFPDIPVRSRRDNERFIDLIASVCFLRQYQKELKNKRDPETQDEIEYIECDLSDYQIAYKLLRGILPSTIMDLPKSARLFYEEVRRMVKMLASKESLKPEEITFTQRQVREQTELNHMFVKRYLKVLVEYEYIKATGVKYRGGRRSYTLVGDEEIGMVDLSMIPSPSEMKRRINR